MTKSVVCDARRTLLWFVVLWFNTKRIRHELGYQDHYHDADQRHEQCRGARVSRRSDRESPES